MTKAVVRSLFLFAAPALAALAGGCFNAPPPKGPQVDSELAQDDAAARLAFSRGAADQAVTLFRRALDRARVMDDAAEIAKAAYNVGAALIRDGKYDAARAALLEAEAETVRSGGNTADVLLLEAKAAQLQDESADALALADRIVTDKTLRPTDSHRLQAHVLRGEVAVELGQNDLAQAELAKATRLLGDARSPALRAGVLGLRGRIEHARHSPSKAAGLFDEQAGLLRRAALYRDMARAESRAAAAYLDAGQPVPAAERFYQAGRSFAAQGDSAEARRLLASAFSAAERRGRRN